MEIQGSSTGERTVLVGVELPGDSSEKVEESLEELRLLAETAGAEVVDVQVQRRKRPDPATYIGRGKAEELSEICSQFNSELIICDSELSPGQANKLADRAGVRVLDRTQIILDIFARRARTREGKLQVELAQLEYMLPRLVGTGHELSRLGGGIGTRGPGETKLEIDRRRIRKRIADLKKEIDEVKKHRELMRQGRKEVPLPVVSLVGYTNAGKSTLLNRLTGAGVVVEDKLFATLDPTTRRVKLPNNQEILLTDTVGFIKNLPHHLVAAFRATLEEVLEADLLLHVVDSSHPDFLEQIEAVNDVLYSLGAGDKQVVMVFNKIDRVKEIPLSPEAAHTVAVSARTGEGFNELLQIIEQAISRDRIRTLFRIPYDKSGLLEIIHNKGDVKSEEYGDAGIEVDVEMDSVWARRIEAKMKKENK